LRRELQALVLRALHRVAGRVIAKLLLVHPDAFALLVKLVATLLGEARALGLLAGSFVVVAALGLGFFDLQRTASCGGILDCKPVLALG